MACWSSGLVGIGLTGLETVLHRPGQQLADVGDCLVHDPTAMRTSSSLMISGGSNRITRGLFSV
jgi:hypothetical protein